MVTDQFANSIKQESEDDSSKKFILTKLSVTKFSTCSWLHVRDFPLVATCNFLQSVSFLLVARAAAGQKVILMLSCVTKIPSEMEEAPLYKLLTLLALSTLLSLFTLLS